MKGIAAALALALLAGCAAGTRPYAGSGAKNLAVRTASSARATLHVHAVDAKCEPRYLGTVALDEPTIGVAIPTGRWTWLEFGFASTGLFSKRTSTSRGTLLFARPGASYEAEVTYRDDIYDVVLRERPPRGPLRAVPLVDFAACRPAHR